MFCLPNKYAFINPLVISVIENPLSLGCPSICCGCVLLFAFAYNGSVVGTCGPAELGILVGSSFPLLCPLAGSSAVAGFDVDPIGNTGLFFRFLCLDFL